MRLTLIVLVTLTLVTGGADPRSAAADEYFGTCSASAGVFLDSTHFVAASDEDAVLRVYRLGVPRPVATRDVSGFLELDHKRPEVDLEGAARTGNRIWWIGSHSRNAEGKRAPNRQRLFTTRVVAATATAPPGLEPVGRPNLRSLDALLSGPAQRSQPLAEAAALAPEAGGLNIEALAAAPDGVLWIGLRSPVPAGRALLVPLLNPEAVLQGERARLGEPVPLDLDGLGVRDLLWAGGHYWILADQPMAAVPFAFTPGRAQVARCAPCLGPLRCRGAFGRRRCLRRFRKARAVSWYSATMADGGSATAIAKTCQTRLGDGSARCGCR